MSMKNGEEEEKKKKEKQRENALRGERKMKEPFLGMARNVSAVEPNESASTMCAVVLD